MSVSNSYVVELRDVIMQFEEKKVLDQLSLQVWPQDRLVIMGQSGSGKSTVLRLILGILQPNAGSIFFKQFEITRLRRRKLQQVRQHIGMVYQYSALLSSRNVRDNVALPLEELTEKSREEIDKIVDEKLELVGMKDAKELMPDQLSGGMKKRVGLARSIIRRPSCVLYDEPTSGLDPVVADSINRLIHRLQRRFGMTSVVVTHDMKSAFDLADRIAYLHEGRIYFHGTPSQLQRSTDRLIQDFLLGRSEQGMAAC